MSKIERGQFSQLLRRYLGMAGDYNVADELAPEVSAILTLESERPEWEFLKGAKLMSAPINISGVAAQPCASRLRNPAGTGVIGIVSPIIISSGVACGIYLARFADQGDLATAITEEARDTRYQSNQEGGALIASHDNNQGLTGNPMHRSWIGAQQPHTITQFYVITPGNQLQVGTSDSDIDLIGSWNWLEKRLDQLEA